jgi:hypothetical protein
MLTPVSTFITLLEEQMQNSTLGKSETRWPLRRKRLWIAGVSVVLAGLVVFSATKAKRPPSFSGNDLALKHLALLEPKRLLAKVGDVELRSEDLRESLQSTFQGRLAQAGLSEEELAAKVGEALETLIQDELLAQAGRLQGLRTNLKGSTARADIAQQVLDRHLAKLPAVEEVELRNFYKNHGEKFVIPSSVKARELFLPLQSPPGKHGKTKDKSYVLGQQLAGRIRKGESLELLAAENVPEEYRDRAQVREFRGGPMEVEDERRVLALKPGEVVGPLRVEGGYSVFQGVALVRSGRIPFYEARNKIKAYLEGRRVEEARKWLVADLQQRRPIQRFAPVQAAAAVQ